MNRDIKKEKEIIKIAEGEIKKFIKQWKKFPYKWETETDVHAELYGRIKSALRSYKPYLAKYDKWKKPEYFNWIYCAPLTYYESNDNKYRMQPDIVIYKRNKGVVKGRINEPMLWVCEIKYKTEWSGDFHMGHRVADIKKLKTLLRQKNRSIKGTDYACCLFLTRKKKPKNDHLYKRRLTGEAPREGRLKKYKYRIVYKKKR